MSEVYRNAKGQTEEEFLASYKPGDYERPSNTVDMLLFTTGEERKENVRKDSGFLLKVLLVKRKDHPYIHHWALPGGFVNIDEDIETAAYRELKEETNVENVYMEQLYTFGAVNRDPRMRIIDIAHMALVPPCSIKPVAGDDAEDVAWFFVKKERIPGKNGESCELLTVWNDELGIKGQYKVFVRQRKNGVVMVSKSEVVPVDGILAFDHAEIINMGIDRLRNKIEYTPIAFNILPEKFTLNEVQQVYEAIFGRTFTKQNFRVWITRFAKMRETGETQKKVGHRPASLYTYEGYVPSMIGEE